MSRQRTRIQTFAYACALGFFGSMGIQSAAAASLPEMLQSKVHHPDIASIQGKQYRPRHEVSAGIGVLPSDAFYVGIAPHAGYTLHFGPHWAWEIAHAGYIFSRDTQLARDLQERYSVQTSGIGPDEIQFFSASSAVFKPLFGKLSLFDRKILYAETQFSLGAGPTQSVSGWHPSLQAGIDARLWLNQFLSLRIGIRNILQFKVASANRSFGVQNHLLVLLSFALSSEMDAEMAEKQ